MKFSFVFFFMAKLITETCSGMSDEINFQTHIRFTLLSGRPNQIFKRCQVAESHLTCHFFPPHTIRYTCPAWLLRRTWQVYLVLSEYKKNKSFFIIKNKKIKNNPKSCLVFYIFLCTKQCFELFFIFFTVGYMKTTLNCPSHTLCYC